MRLEFLLKLIFKNRDFSRPKKHASVDMQSGLTNKVAVTPANVPDAKAYKNICPNQGATYADKGYCTKEANRDAKIKGCYLRAIKKNNMVRQAKCAITSR